ncbi:WPP domain-interacting tail-anchored protein 1 [Raphanus sativus]|nr:WPP domain-interacting tail-anchored protein 1 [Raphanus sativus]
MTTTASYQSLAQHDGETISKLHDAKQSLEQLLDKVLEMKKQSSNFHKLCFVLDELATSKKHVLRMLEKSLTKEMELDKKLSESRNTEYELGMKVYSSSHDILTT